MGQIGPEGSLYVATLACIQAVPIPDMAGEMKIKLQIPEVVLGGRGRTGVSEPPTVEEQGCWW